MSDSEEHQFESKADAGASKTYPQQAGTIRKNGYIVIKNRPCKVSRTSAAHLLDVFRLDPDAIAVFLLDPCVRPGVSDCRCMYTCNLFIFLRAGWSWMERVDMRHDRGVYLVLVCCAYQ